MPLIKGRRRSSVLAEAVRGANKILLVCQELLDKNQDGRSSEAEDVFEEVDSEEREQAAAVDELEEEVEEEGEDEAVAWDKYHHFRDNSFDEGQSMHDTSVQSGLLDNQAISLDNNQDSRDPEETRSKAKVSWNKIVEFVQSSHVIRTWTEPDIYPESAAWFLGPKAENLELFQELVAQTINEHAEFRKYKYFPLDPQYVSDKIKEKPSYKKAESKLRIELDGLSERLKNSVPFFNFRSQGHMLWDTTMASNLGYISALLYNQNNVASMASGVTLQLEREASMALCRMVGYKVKGRHATRSPLSWGHLPNGGTVANIEAMWAARCLKYNGLAVQKMMREKFSSPDLANIRDTFTYRRLDGEEQLLIEATPWQLLNIPIDEAIDLFDKLLKFINQTLETRMSFDSLFALVLEFTMEQQGVLDFFDSLEDVYPRPRMGKWFVPGSRHYSWDKGNNILGMGRRNLVKVSVDEHCRMDLNTLEAHLQECLEDKVPVIGVTAVFGTTQEGSVDDLVHLLELRDKFEKDGLTFYIHVDGAWGGYFAATLWDINGNQMEPKAPLPSWASETFPSCRLSNHFERQLRCLEQANSITLDPHKTGFCPYPAGGLLYRNGNIRKFLAQTAAYVNHGTKDNEEINLYGIDGSKPGAASAGVWLSHKVVGLNNAGYGLILRQCKFSAGLMYSMWMSLERPEDPFVIVPATPVKHTIPFPQTENIPGSEEIQPDFPTFQMCGGPPYTSPPKEDGAINQFFAVTTAAAFYKHLKDLKLKCWTKKRIRKEIIGVENQTLIQNERAMEFIEENGSDTLINCLSVNFRTWDYDSGCWRLNSDIERQHQFLEAFYKRCSHSIEKPSMVDRGIQIILNSTTWEESTHGNAFKNIKRKLGLRSEEEGDEKKKIKMLINTCMSPWLSSQKTFQRISIIVRNELYNAYGAVTDEPECLSFVSPCSLENQEKYAGWSNDGFLFGELEASFSKVRQGRQYHAVGLFCVRKKDRADLLELAQLANLKAKESKVTYLPLRIRTTRKMTVFQLMTSSQQGGPELTRQKSTNQSRKGTKKRMSTSDYLEKYSDLCIQYDQIHQPEIEVEFYYSESLRMTGYIKLRRVIRYHHLSRDFVDEHDYPPTQEYLLYSYKEHAYMSHCPNRWPDFQQLVELDYVPVPPEHHQEDPDSPESLYKEAVSRGVIVHLPEVEVGGRPLLRKGHDDICRDPINLHTYNAVSWSDQGAFTGEMMSVSLEWVNKGSGKRWFDGTNINKHFDKADFPMLFTSEGSRRSYPEEEVEEEDDDIYAINEETDK